MGSIIDETGKTYGYLTVIKRVENTKEGRANWLCRCKCGKLLNVSGKSLRSGNTKSCGCYQKEQAVRSNMKRGGDLVGKRFGKLLVLEEAGFVETTSRRRRVYNCLCDCGNHCQVQHQYLTGGDTKSCGCLSSSKGELQIWQLLKEHNINYQRQYSFEDLKDQDFLKFDFAIFDKSATKLICLIEYQGEQHYQQSNGFYQEIMVEHDKMKKSYCEKRGIELKYIFYKKDYDLTWKDLGLEGKDGL